MSVNYQQAPELKFIGEKQKGNQSYIIPQELADIIFKELGNSSAQLRIMMVLIGTKEGFKISEQWILDRTGLQHSSYINARKALIERGWLNLEAAQSITVNFNNIRGNTILPRNTILRQRGNTILRQRGNTTIPITNNITNNITNKGETEREVPSFRGTPLQEETSLRDSFVPKESQNHEEKKSYPKITIDYLDSIGCKYEKLDNNLIKVIDTEKVFEVS